MIKVLKRLEKGWLSVSKQYKSNSGHQFTQEEIEDLPPFDWESYDSDAELEYENEHGISPLEVREIIDELEREREAERENELETDTMVDAHGQRYERLKSDAMVDRHEKNELETDTMVDVHGQQYEQLKLNLDDEPKQVETEAKDTFDKLVESFQMYWDDEPEQAETERVGNESKKETEQRDRLLESVQLDYDNEREQVETLKGKSKKKASWKDKFGELTESFQKAKYSVDKVSVQAAVIAMTVQEKELERLRNKRDLVAQNREAKNTILDFANGTITKEELAYRMANDSTLQESIGRVSHNMLHPSPVKGLEKGRTHLHLDVGYGFAVFLDEMRTPTENEVETLMEIDNMTMLVEMGQDKNIPPTVRENYLREAGITDDNMTEFVTRDDYRDYVVALEQKFRAEHMERLGLLDKDVLDVEDENMLNELVEDSMSLYDSEKDTFEFISSPDGEIQTTYEETYNMSSEEMFNLFDNVDNYDGLTYEDLRFPDYVDYTFEDAEFMRSSVEEYHQLQTMSIAESEAYEQAISDEIRALETQQSAKKVTHEQLELFDEDLEILEQYAPQERSNNDLDSLSQHEPPELSDEDLASLADHEPELSDDDLDDLRDDELHYQR